MKKLKYTLFFAVITMLASCSDDFLEPAPTSVISSANYFSTPKEVETEIINIYDGIQGINSTSTNDNHAIQYEFYLTEMRSDNTRTKI